MSQELINSLLIVFSISAVALAPIMFMYVRAVNAWHETHKQLIDNVNKHIEESNGSRST